MRLFGLCLLLLAAACSGPSATRDPDQKASKEPEPLPEIVKEQEKGLAEERETADLTDTRAVPEVKPGDAEELARVWDLYRRGDPRWTIERDRYVARGEGAAYLLGAQLLRLYMRVNAERARYPKQLAAVKREIVEVGPVGAPALVDLMILDKIRMRDDNWFWPDDITRKDCQEMLEEMGAGATPYLMRALKRKDLGIKARRMLASAMGGTGDVRVYDTLVYLLRNDEAWQVRADAASALSALGDRRAVVPLTEAVKTDDDPFVVRQSGKAKLELLDPARKTQD
jgi:hypothetical protein